MQYAEFFVAKTEHFHWTVLIFFIIYSQNNDCGYTLEPPRRRGGSNEYPQSMFWIKTIEYPCIPQFCYIKVEFKGVFITWTCFPGVEYLIQCKLQTFCHDFFIQLNVPFNIISADMRRANQ